MSPEAVSGKSSRRRIRPVIRRAQGYVDAGLDMVIPRKCRFTFFRVGVDLCAKCGKTRKEHE